MKNSSKPIFKYTGSGDMSRKGFYRGCQAFGCVHELYAKPAWIALDDFAYDLDYFFMVGDCKHQINSFINSQDVRGFDKHSAKAYVPGVRSEDWPPRKCAHG